MKKIICLAVVFVMVFASMAVFAVEDVASVDFGIPEDLPEHAIEIMPGVWYAECDGTPTIVPFFNTGYRVIPSVPGWPNFTQPTNFMNLRRPNNSQWFRLHRNDSSSLGTRLNFVSNRTNVFGVNEFQWPSLAGGSRIWISAQFFTFTDDYRMQIASVSSNPVSNVSLEIRVVASAGSDWR